MTRQQWRHRGAKFQRTASLWWRRRVSDENNGMGGSYIASETALTLILPISGERSFLHSWLDGINDYSFNTIIKASLRQCIITAYSSRRLRLRHIKSYCISII